MTGTYRMTWPVTDPTMPLARLLTQAEHDLRAALAVEHLRAAGAPEWRLRHQRGALRLIVEIPVADAADAPAPLAQRPLQPHGTHAAYTRHKAAGHAPCEACVQAERTYQRDRKRRARREDALSRAIGATA